MKDFRIFEAGPGNHALLLPDSPKFTIVALTNDFLKSISAKKEDVIGKGYFELFSSYEDDLMLTPHTNTVNSFNEVINHKKSSQISKQGLKLINEKNKSASVHWKSHNIPVLDDKGEILYIINTLEELDADSNKGKSEIISGLKKSYNLFMNAPVIIGILKGDDYIIELANESLLEVWGRSKEVIGKPLLEAIPELKDQGFVGLLDQVRKTGEPFYAYEFPITLVRNGKPEVLYFDFVYKAIYNDEENPGIANGIVSVGHDVTPQVIARQSMSDSESKYRNLFKMMDQGFCVLEMIFDENNHPVDYKFLETNPVFEKQTGLVDPVGKTALQLVPNLEKHWLELYGKVATSGESMRFIEGSEAMGRWFEVYAFRMGESNSKKVALLFTDITERRKSEEALKQSEKNLRNTILQAPFAMAILKGNRFVVEIANERMYELWGRSPEDLLGKSIFEGLPEVRDQGYEELLNGVFTTGEPFAAQGIPVKLPRNGKTETVYINLLYTAFREGDGKISAIIAVATDVTEQVVAKQQIEKVVAVRTKELAEANEALLHSNQELQRSNSNLEEFAYAASHDLKEPMRKIQLFSDRLKDNLQDKLDLVDKNYLDRILHATQRMNTLIDDLLMYSHVSRGAALEEKIDLNQKVKTVLGDLELEIEEKKAIINVGSLPTIKGHRRQMQQLFQNLISNAIKYSKQDTRPEVNITSRLVNGNDYEQIPSDKKNQQYHLIEVTDNGIGFEPEEAEKIFNIFTRLHGNAEYKGTGIGLSIARKVVENHGGNIWAESKPGEGASFKILLPAE